MKVKIEIDSKTVTTHAEVAEYLRHTAERIIAAWGPGRTPSNIGGNILDAANAVIGKWSVRE